MEECMKLTRISAALVLGFMLCISSLALAQDDTQSQEEVFDLGDVLILGKSGDAGQATTTNVISMEDMKQIGATNVADALEQVPGIDISIHPKSGPQLKMRGYGADEIKILIDGVPAYETYDGYLDLSQIPVDSIAKIEITKGVASALYGANSMGGVINIVTKKGGKTPKTNITASIGENSTRNVTVSTSGSKNQFNYALSGSFRESDGWDVSDDFDPNNTVSGIGTEYNEDGGTRDLSEYTYRTLNAKAGYEFAADSKVYLSFDYHDNDRGCPTSSDRYWAYSEWKQWHFNLVGEHAVTSNISLKGRLFYVKHDDTLEDVSWDDDHSTGRKWFEKSSYEDDSTGGELQAYVNLTENNLLKIGTTYVRDNHTQQDFLDEDCMGVIRWGDPVGYQPEEDYAADTYSFAIEDELRFFNNKLTLLAGLSYDVFSPEEANGQPVPDSTDTINPQAGLVYDVDNTLQLHTSVGKKTRFPRLKELYSEMAGGNPELEAEESINYEIGLDKSFTDNLNVTVALFYSDIDNKIDEDENDDGDNIYVNKGEAKNKGLEASVHYVTSFNLNVGVGYTYLKSTEKADENSPELDADYTPKHKLTFDLRYRFDFGLTASGQVICTGKQIEYDDNDDKQDVGGFTIVNLRLSQELTMFKSLTPEIFLEADNLLDKNYYEGNGPTQGRSILLGASMTF